MAALSVSTSLLRSASLSSRSVWSALRWDSPFSYGFTLPALTITIPSLRPLTDLFPPFLLAVPKKKVSHSRKSMRSANKGLEDKTHIVACPACGGPKLAHHLCPSCYSSMSREWKANNKEMVEVELGGDANRPAPS
ncbi:hypothetical protein FRB93_004725 [Tulasnella sp. JGI-2019a]|nr:hypothetical protein FRB93_004725 [Tulasnella sp. JGI-2019a]